MIFVFLGISYVTVALAMGICMAVYFKAKGEWSQGDSKESCFWVPIFWPIILPVMLIACIILEIGKLLGILTDKLANVMKDYI